MGKKSYELPGGDWVDGAVVVDVGSHAYAYDGSGNLTTDTWTVGGLVRVKTYTYTAGNLTSESAWV